VPGNGWEIRVRAHTDFHTFVSYVPKFTTMNFAKILSDKGAGSLAIPLDDPVLFPADVFALNANPLLASGVSDYTGTGCSVSLVQPGPPGASLPNSLFVVPDGISPVCWGGQTGNPFPVIPGQRYTVRCLMYGATAGLTPLLGIQFSDTFGGVTAVYDTSRVLPAGKWAKYGTTVTAPPNSMAGWVIAGLGNSPATSTPLYVQALAATYENLSATTLPQALDPDAPAHKVTDLAPGPATTGDYILLHEHLFEVWRDGVHLFDFTGQSVTNQQVDPSEQRTATITGPGTVSTLGWARAMPPGFPNIVFKTDAIQDGFAEIDQNGNPLLDTNIWNESAPLNRITLNPQGTCQITCTPGSTSLGASPYDLTSSSLSAQINPPFVVDTLNGPSSMDNTQTVQFFIASNNDPSYCFMQLTHNTFTATMSTRSPGFLTPINPLIQTKDLGKYDPNNDAYWRISESSTTIGTETTKYISFWTSPDGQNWTLKWKTPYTWDATNIHIKFTGIYDTDGIVAFGITNINGDIITPTSAGNIFLLTPIMGVWKQLFDQAQARGTIPFVSTLLNAATDSFGNVWQDAMSVQIQNGTDLYSLLQTHAGIVNADWVMQPNFNLQVGLALQTTTGGRSLGRDLTSTVFVHEAQEITARQFVRARDQVENSVGAVNTDGTVVNASDSVSIQRYGQREGWAETAQAVNPQSMQIVLESFLAEFKDEIVSETISVLPSVPGATPLFDFDVGDWISREVPSYGNPYTEAVRVLGISFAIDSTGAETCELTIFTYRQWLQQQLAYLVNKFGGQFVNALGTTPVTSTGTPGTVPTVVAPDLGGLSDVSVGTDDMDPLVYSVQTDTWQNASNIGPTGSPLGLAVGPSGGPKASLMPESGQTLTVGGGAPWTVLSAFQAPSAAPSEVWPAMAVPMVQSAGNPNEQLAFLLMSPGSNGNSAFAVLITSDSADNSVMGHVRIGRVDPGAAPPTWVFTTTTTF
jgi:hypothetical protein